MKEILLTRGKVAIVDDEDYDYLNKWKWQASSDGTRFYAVRCVYIGRLNGKQRHDFIRMHRLIMNPPKDMYIDHINHDGLDNRRSNLRIVTHRQNHCNRLNNRKIIGVHAHGNGFVARIAICKRSMHIGCFKTEQEASDAYNEVFNYINRIEHLPMSPQDTHNVPVPAASGGGVNNFLRH